MKVHVTTLGHLGVVTDGESVPGISSQPVRAALLVYLATEGQASRESILACIWPEHAPAYARHTLSQTLYQLRRDLGEGWVEADGAYLRVTGDLECDARAFVDAVESASYEEAIARYGGPFLDGCHLVSVAAFEGWVDRVRGRLARLHRKARRARTAELVELGELEPALAVARGWIRIEPFEDEAQRRLMQLLAEAGEVEDALRRYGEFADALAREGLEPLPATRGLADSLRGTDDIAVAPHSAPFRRPPAPGAAGGGGRRIGSLPFRRVLWAGAAAAVLAAVLGLLAALHGPPEASGIASVAVLPFTDMGGDDDHAYFVDGIHEALIGELGRVSDLRVTSRTSVARYRGSDLPTPAIADELGVDALVEGSVLRAGDSVRVSARLIHADPDTTVATVTYTRDPRRVLALVREVARGIAGEFSVALPARRPRMTPPPPVELETLEAYLRGRQALNAMGAEAWRTAAEWFTGAIRLDSAFAPAHAGLSATRFLEGFFGVSRPGDGWSAARDEALIALELDADLGEAHAVLGLLYVYEDWDWDRAERALGRALELDPGDAIARHGLADLMTLRGDPDEAVRQVMLGRETDPFSALANAPLVGHLYLAGRFDEALNEARRLGEAFPELARAGDDFAIEILWAMGHHEEALDAFLAAGDDPVMAGLVARGRERGGPTAAMYEAARHAETRPDRHGPVAIATLYTRGGDHDAALSWLERAALGRRPSFLHVIANPTFAPLRSHPRYRALMREHRFPAPDRRSPGAAGASPPGGA